MPPRQRKGAILPLCFCARQKHNYQKKRPSDTAIRPKTDTRRSIANQKTRSGRRLAAYISIIFGEKDGSTPGKAAIYKAWPFLAGIHARAPAGQPIPPLQPVPSMGQNGGAGTI